MVTLAKDYETEAYINVLENMDKEMAQKCYPESKRKYAPCPCCIGGQVISPYWICKCGFEAGLNFDPNAAYCSYCAENGKLGLIEYEDDKLEKTTIERCKLCGQEELFNSNAYNEYDDSI